MRTVGCVICFFIAACVSGCAQEVCGDMVSQSPTNVSPAAGSWTASVTINASSLTQTGFVVIASSAGDAIVRITSDGYKYYETSVVNGTFAYSNGNYASGMDCPSDGFVISGRFTSASTATGHYASLQYCTCLNESDFTAQHEP